MVDDPRLETFSFKPSGRVPNSRFPVLLHRAAYDPRPTIRTGTWLLLAGAGALLGLSLPLFPIDLQAYGNNLAATILLAAGLVWHMRHPPADAALPDPAGKLQLDANNKAHSQG